MLPSTASAGLDSRPAALDKLHPTTGDCTGCHTTTPTFGSDLTPGSRPANHIPTTAPCTQCHTTAGNYAAYSRTETHPANIQSPNHHAPPLPAAIPNISIV